MKHSEFSNSKSHKSLRQNQSYHTFQLLSFISLTWVNTHGNWMNKYTIWRNTGPIRGSNRLSNYLLPLLFHFWRKNHIFNFDININEYYYTIFLFKSTGMVLKIFFEKKTEKIYYLSASLKSNKIVFIEWKPLFVLSSFRDV